ncbi:MAG: glutamate--tRNA ligase, partial [Candidatus Aminicenantaceae bacterium]
PMDPEGVEKYLRDDRLAEVLPKLQNDFKGMAEFDAESIERAVRERAEEEGIKAAVLIHALRMIVLGMPVSPGIFDVLELAGPEKTIARIEQYLKAEESSGH